MNILIHLAGVLLVLLTLVDIFFTVLFPASGHGPLRRPMTRMTWYVFRTLARRLPGRRRRDVLAYIGPVLVGLSIAVWPVLLIAGWAMIYYPALGTGVVATGGPTSRDWGTALYFSGFSLTTLGTGDLVPAGALWRWVCVTEAAVGFAVVSIVTTYFLSLYGAIVQRKTFAAGLDHRTQGRGDSPQLVIALAVQGGSSALVGQLSRTGEFLERTFETHRSYPVLRYFHYHQIRYSLPRILLLTLDAATLLPAALEGEDRRKLSDGAAAALVYGAAQDLLHELVPKAFSEGPRPDDGENEWAARFVAHVERFRAAGLKVRSDADAVAEYIERRRTWDGPLRTLAAEMLYDWDEIETRPRHHVHAENRVGSGAG
jgi:hypothetical protein